jgi:hypothetical protein
LSGACYGCTTRSPKESLRGQLTPANRFSSVGQRRLPHTATIDVQKQERGTLGKPVLDVFVKWSLKMLYEYRNFSAYVQFCNIFSSFRLINIAKYQVV